VRRISVTAFVTAILLGLLSPIGSPVDAQVALPMPRVRAGVAVTDMTWNVGSGAGQYAGDRGGIDPQNGEIDPHLHSVKSKPSKGVHSRLTTRTLVVEGNNGEKVALVKTDNYLAQDLYTRRAAQHLAAAGSSITYDDIVLSATHNHSSPYNMTPSAGLLLFQDAFDLRMFEFQARKIAESILAAEADLRPAQMGATTVHHDIFKGNIVGPGRADDGTPAGYPRDFGDEGLVVLRFDDMTNPAAPKPLATWMNYGQHPESLDETNIITADFLSALERHVDRATGAPLVFTQGDVGSAEGPYDHWNGGQMERLPSGEYRAWAHTGHAQMERGARHLADSVLEGWDQIGEGGGTVPFTSDFPVNVFTRLTPGPVSHPYPSLSNCKMEGTIEGNPGMPTGEDCSRELDNNDPTRQEFEQLKALGIPVPDHFDHPGHMLLEENNRLKLQVVRLGDVILASCSCEAQVDLILNLESRLNDTQGDIWDGFDWGADYTQNADTTWSAPGLPTISDLDYRRMQAQVHNDAKGWDDPANAVAANSEPLDTTKIWGNFTKEELSPELGYKIAVGMGHTGDYSGYTVSYREYMTRNHYRKSLTSYGPHTADYMNTRLVRMAAELHGGPAIADEPTHALGLADEARAVAFSEALGRAAGAAYDAYLLGMSADKDPGVIVAQPAPTVQRFGAATFAWQGGNNAVDNPLVRVERLVDGAWAPFADMSGEVQTFLEWPKGVQGVANAKTGSHAWRWTANFEAFDAWPRTTVPGGQVPNGTYRFAVDGKAAQLGGAVQPYSLTSDSFDVTPWTGISVSDLRREANGDVSFVVDPIAYPRTYSNPAVSFFIKDDGKTAFCELCAFRPWATTGSVASAAVTRGDGTKVPASLDAATGRWVAPAQLWNGASALVAPGDVLDEYGEVNGTASAPVVGNEVLSGGDLPVANGQGQSVAPVRSGRDLPFRNVSSLLRAAGALSMLLVIIALFLGVGVGSKARRG
jgi:Neutral/alkaline non-lysosomal ceramidase, N-terminal